MKFTTGSHSPIQVTKFALSVSFPISSWHQDIEQKFHSLPVRKLARKWKWFFIYFVERAPTHKWLRLHDHAPDTKIYKDVEVLKKDYKSLPC